MCLKHPITPGINITDESSWCNARLFGIYSWNKISVIIIVIVITLIELFKSVVTGALHWRLYILDILRLSLNFPHN